MPLVNYRVSEEAVLRWKRSDRVVPGLRWECNDRVVSRLHEIHEVTGRRQSAKQVLLLFKEPTKRGLGLHSAVSSNPFCNGVVLSGAKRSQRGPKGHPLGISQNGAKTLGSV